MTDPLIPLSVLALDLGTTATALAAKLADRVLVDDLGRPAIDRDIARQLIAEHQTRQTAQAAAERHRNETFRRNIAAQLEPLHHRVKVLQQRQAQLRADGVIDGATPALAVAAGADKVASLDRKGRQFDAYLRGESSYVPLHPQKES